MSHRLPKRLIKTRTMEIIEAKSIHRLILSTIDYVVLLNLPQFVQNGEAGDIQKVHSFLTRTALGLAKYAILSHRWGGHELLFKDLQDVPSIPLPVIRQAIDKCNSGDSVLLDGEPSHLWLIEKMNEYDARSDSHSLDNKKTNSDQPDCPLIDTLFELVTQRRIASRPVDSGFRKLVHFCYHSLHEHKCEFAWMDTCCIDKSSSAELDESIRSMFNWYKTSAICIIYLGSTRCEGGKIDAIVKDPWFTRGWTLQELLGPTASKFYDKDWKTIFPGSNDKRSNDKLDGKISSSRDDEDESEFDEDVLNAFSLPRGANAKHYSDLERFLHAISRFTDIPVDSILQFKPGLDDARKRLSWVSKRQTTRIEDHAYCMIGMLDVTMPIAYGEGHNAFYRLQEAIIRNSNDRSLFIWCGRSAMSSTMLASSPSAFSSECNTITWNVWSNGHSASAATSRLHFSITNHGLAITLALYSNMATRSWLRYTEINFGPSQTPKITQTSLPFCRLAILGYDQSVEGTVFMLLIQSQDHGETYFVRHPWQPRAFPGVTYSPPEDGPQVVYIR